MYKLVLTHASSFSAFRTPILSPFFKPIINSAFYV